MTLKQQDMMLKQLVEILNAAQKVAKEETAKQLSDLLDEVNFNKMDVGE
jgi:hypothetical protein